jgi:hypothetical protein
MFPAFYTQSEVKAKTKINNQDKISAEERKEESESQVGAAVGTEKPREPIIIIISQNTKTAKELGTVEAIWEKKNADGQRRRLGTTRSV